MGTMKVREVQWLYPRPHIQVAADACLILPTGQGTTIMYRVLKKDTTLFVPTPVPGIKMYSPYVHVFLY